MRSLLISCLVVFTSQSAFSQATAKASHYILPEFVKGIVKLKTGAIIAQLNYNTFLEKMIIDQDGNRREIGALETIDTVYLERKKFISAGKKFYEVVADMPVPFYIQHTCRVRVPGEAVGYGGTSQLSNTSSPVTKQSAGLFFGNYLPDNYIVTPQQTVILKKDGLYIEALNYKKVAGVFPGKEDAIKKFVKDNKTDFNNPDDVKKLILAFASTSASDIK